MEKILDELYPDSRFPELFKNFQALKEFVQDFENKRFELLNDLYAKIRECKAKAFEPGPAQEAITKFNELIPDIESFNAYDTKRHILNYWASFHVLMQRGEVPLRDEHLKEILDFYMDMDGLKCTVRAMDHLVNRIGNWFAEGALGPGMFSYNGKIYAFEEG